MKVLIAEDDEFDRTLLEGLVRQWGYEVISTRDGANS
jgi:CheY-like chemotaxis protein